MPNKKPEGITILSGFYCFINEIKPNCPIEI